MLFYNELHFDRAGIGYPDRHWTWDVVEGIARALGSLRMKNDAGQPIYPLELPLILIFGTFSARKRGTRRSTSGSGTSLAHDTRESQMHALEWIHLFFCGLTVTAPPTKPGRMPGALFARQRSSLLIAPSDFAAALPKFRYAFTLMPADSRERAWPG